MSSTTTVDERVLQNLRGRDKLTILLKSKLGSVEAWAESRGFGAAEVGHTLASRREYPRIREAMAEDLGMTRAEVDQLLAKKPSRRTAVPLT